MNEYFIVPKELHKNRMFYFLIFQERALEVMLISQDDSENVSLFQQVLGHGIVYATGLFGELNSWQHL